MAGKRAKALVRRLFSGYDDLEEEIDAIGKFQNILNDYRLEREKELELEPLVVKGHLDRSKVPDIVADYMVEMAGSNDIELAEEAPETPAP